MIQEIQGIHLVLFLLEFQVVRMDLVVHFHHVALEILGYRLFLVVHFHHVLHVGLVVQVGQLDLRIEFPLITSRYNYKYSNLTCGMKTSLYSGK